MTFQHFKLDIDADGIALVTWDTPGRSMNVIDLKVIEELVRDRRAGRDRRRDQGRGHHVGQGDVLRRRRPHPAGRPRPRVRATWARPRVRRRPRPRCSRRAASSRCSIAGWRPAASRGSPRSTAPRSAAASSSRSPATIASRRRIRRRGSACPRSRSACSPAPAAPRASRACCRAGDALQFLLKGDQLRIERAKAMKLIDAIVPAADLVKTAKDWIKAEPEGQGAVGHGRLPAAGRPGLFQGRHDDVPGRQRDLSARDLRQLSGGARHPAGGLRGPAAAVRSRAAGRVALVRKDPALARSGRDDAHAVRLACRTSTRARAGPPPCRRPSSSASASSAPASWARASPMSRRQAGLEVVLIDRDQESADKGKALSREADQRPGQQGPRQRGRSRRAARPHHGERRLRRAEGLRSRHRGGVRGPQGEGRGDQEGAGRDRRRRGLRLQHLDAADHLARRASSTTRAASSASISSRRSRR